MSHRPHRFASGARANACRVIADWPCQRKAARDARLAAERAHDRVTGTRALIIESRAAIALQDYTAGERLLGETELALAVDVTEQVHQADDLREQNVRDVLTGTYNRRYVGAFERAQRDRGRWGCLAIDLDHFKSINDTYGHERGDAVLVPFARFLPGHLREGDAIVRPGGDEFVVLLPDCDATKLDGLVERLRGAAGQAPCPFSIGPALRENAEPLADTLARADAAMYGGRRMRRGADLGTAH